ncbi:AGE family epimerase/isomerase [Nibricoccus sp. IMCC34717]|uniref:AGE family epimerase/isomerase n=1 Tax=Nibricoccus sp. IMCC34717 TaxID=3034021 RepID=UPI00384BF821
MRSFVGLLALASALLMAAPAPAFSGPEHSAIPAAMDARAALGRLAQKLDEELTGNILPYWLAHARNPANGGFYGLVDAANKPWPGSERGALLTARILWTFSAAYHRDRRPEYLEMAQVAFRDLQRFVDREHGGLFWSLTADGRPLDMSKQVYLHSFGIYSLAAFFQATGDAAALEQAKELHRLVDAKAHDPKAGGYFEVFTREWKRNGLFPPKSVVGPTHPKSQNTNLHMLECLTQLLRVWPDEGLRARLREQISIMCERVRDPATNHLGLYFTEAWTPINDECSYGHDIEFTWLLCEAAEVAGGEALLAEVKPVALAVVDTVMREGMDTDGAIWDTGTPKGGVANKRKDWWPQAEAVVAFINAFQLTGDPRYAAAAEKTWAFIEAEIVDRKGGEWWLFATNDPARRARLPKIAMWKCPYHNGRACMEGVDRVRALLAN